MRTRQLLLINSFCILSSAAFAQSQPPEPAHNGQVDVKNTIVIKKPGTYDFKGVLHVWKGTNWNCTADRENGPQILRIESDDVIVKNFHYVGDGKTKGSRGLGDPIHITSCGSGQGNQCSQRAPVRVTLDGIVGHACEDMITIGTPGGSDITIKNSWLKANPSKSAWDKTAQVNFGSRITFQNNDFIGGQTCIRFKPNTNGSVIGNRFWGCNVGLRATSDDADIAPMKNGPVRVLFQSNKCYNCGAEMKNSGSKVYIER